MGCESKRGVRVTAVFWPEHFAYRGVGCQRSSLEVGAGIVFGTDRVPNAS